MNKTPTIIEAIGYLLFKLKQADKIKLVKLVYLADKYHAMNYGRTITGDTFFALPNGPIGSRTMDVLEYDAYVLGGHMKTAKAFFKQGGGHRYISGEKCRPASFKMLAESDIEALDFAINNFGKMRTWHIVSYTHKLKEWEQFQPLFKSKKTKKERIQTEEILLPSGDKYFAVSKEHLKESLEIMTGPID